MPTGVVDFLSGPFFPTHLVPSMTPNMHCVFPLRAKPALSDASKVLSALIVTPLRFRALVAHPKAPSTWSEAEHLMAQCTWYGFVLSVAFWATRKRECGRPTPFPPRFHSAQLSTTPCQARQPKGAGGTHRPPANMLHPSACNPGAKRRAWRRRRSFAVAFEAPNMRESEHTQSARLVTRPKHGHLVGGTPWSRCPDPSV